MKCIKLLPLLLISFHMGYAQDTETICDDFAADGWEATEGDIVGYTQEGEYSIESVSGEWSSHDAGYGYWVGALTFNFESTNQTAVFNILNGGCPWGENSITINGTTEVNLGTEFPVTIDGYTINLDTSVPDGEFGDNAELTIEGDFSFIRINGCETAILDLCVTKEVEDDVDEDEETNCDEFATETWEATEGDIVGYTQEGEYAIESVTGEWSSHDAAYGYWVGGLTFNFEPTNQTAVFTILNGGCPWSDNSIIINGTTEVNLGGSFPVDIDGFTINLDTSIPDGDFGDNAELTVEGNFSTITFDGCETAISSLCVTKENTDIDDASITSLSANPAHISLYPNPATNNIQITAEGAITAYTIYSITGEKVTSQRPFSSNNILVDISDLEKGVYLIQVESNNQLNTVRFAKR